MLHAMTRLAARFFGGNFGQPPGSGCLPNEVSWEGRGGRLPALLWAGPEAREPVVLLHGLQNAAWVWARVGGLLQTHFPVLAPSMRGHGVDNAPPTGYSLEQTSLDLQEFLDEFGVARCHLAGHSWGGKVATHFVGSYPERVASLTLADPVPPQGLNPLLRAFPGLVHAAFAPERLAFADEAALERGSRRLVYLGLGDEIDRRVWREKFRQTSSGSFVPRLPQSAFDELVNESFSADICALAATITCPVLLLRPLFTVSFLPGETARLRRAFCGARMQRIAGDHTFIHSNSQDTAAAITAFLNGIRQGDA